MSVNDISDDALLARAVKNARSSHHWHPRWTAVADIFSLGSTYSAELCRRYGVDPDAQVRRGSGKERAA